jgi:hypothetical protein
MPITKAEKADIKPARYALSFMGFLIFLVMFVSGGRRLVRDVFTAFPDLQPHRDGDLARPGVLECIRYRLTCDRAQRVRCLKRQHSLACAFGAPVHLDARRMEMLGDLQAQVCQHLLKGHIGPRGVVDDVAQVGERLADHQFRAPLIPGVQRAHELHADIVVDVAGDALAFLGDAFS